IPSTFSLLNLAFHLSRLMFCFGNSYGFSLNTKVKITKIIKDKKTGIVTACTSKKSPYILLYLSFITYELIPTIMEALGPFLIARLEYKPSTIGQMKADCNPPNANKFKKMSKSGGLIANKKATTPTTPVTPILTFFTLLSGASGLI